MRKQLARKIDINWIDLSQKTPLRLRVMQKSIYAYDLKRASTVIWGDDKVTDIMPSIRASDLRSYEIVTLFFTRLWPFIGGIDRQSFALGLNSEPSRFFRNQMAKAVLATVDVNLLMLNAYTPSYIERVDLSLKDYEPSEAEIVKWALSEKLEPQGPIMSGKEVTEMYDRVHDLYSKIMLKGLSFHFGENIKDHLDIEKRYCKSRQLSMFKFLNVLMRTSSVYDKETRINTFQTYLFFSYAGGNKFHSTIVDDLIKKIDELPGNHSAVDDWYSAAKLVSQIRNNI